MKRRLLSALVALALCLTLLPPQEARADAVSAARVTHVGTSATLTHYVEYEYAGKAYRSDSTGAIFNYAAWQTMSDGDKRKVTKWFAGFNSQMEEQFSGASAMREFAMGSSGWQQAGEALRDRLAAKYYPELKAFYEDGTGAGAYQLSETDRARLKPAELEAYDEAANTYGVAYSMGLAAYQKLVELKQKQVNAAVTSISSGLIDLIMKYSMPPRPGEVLSTLEDTLEGYIKDSIGIENKIKDLVGLSRLTGEDTRIEADKAAKVIEIFWELMGVQESMAFKCMTACKRQQGTLESLGASCAAVAQQRADALAAAEAERRQDYENAVAAGVAQTDIDPELGDLTQGAGETLTDFNERRLAAAQTWASAQFDGERAGLSQLWASYNPAVQGNQPAGGSYDYEGWAEWNNLPKTFYTRCFRSYLNLLRNAETDVNDDLTPAELMAEDRYVLSDCYPISLITPKNAFQYHTNYRELRSAIYAGFDAADAALAAIEREIGAYINVWEQRGTDYRTAAQPYRNRAYNLAYSNCGWEDDGYGNWGVADSRWESLQSDFAQECDAIRKQYDVKTGETGKDAYGLLEGVRGKRNEIARSRANYEEQWEEFEAALPQVYELYAYSQDELDYSLWLAMQSIQKLETLQNSYPDWLKNAKTGYSPIGAGTVAARDGRTGDALETTVFAGVSSVSERCRIMEEQLVPALLDYRRQENALLADLNKANNLFQEAVNKRKADDQALWGRPAELVNLNALQLGSMTIQNHVDMMQACGYYDYLYGQNGKSVPKRTAAIEPLLADLSGESPYMAKIRALHAELLEKKGDYLRMAQAGTLLTAPYSGGVTWDDHFVKNGSYSNYTTGIYGDAFFRSYTSSNVYNYWYENINPIIRELQDIVYHNVPYTPVTGLDKGGAQARAASPGTIFASLIRASDRGADLSLEVGESAALTVAVQPANATHPDLVWSSSDETVATVDQNGVVTGLLPGSATVTAVAVDSPSDARISVSFSVKVANGAVTSLAELGDGYFLLAPKVSRSGNRLTVSGRLGTNGSLTGTALVAGEYGEQNEVEVGAGNEFLSATVLFAAYDGERFLGCATAECITYRGELCDLNATIDLNAQSVGTPTVRMFLLERGAFVPAMGYTPITLPN